MKFLIKKKTMQLLISLKNDDDQEREGEGIF